MSTTAEQIRFHREIETEGDRSPQPAPPQYTADDLISLLAAEPDRFERNRIAYLLRLRIAIDTHATQVDIITRMNK